MITIFKTEDRGIRQLDFPAVEPGCWINAMAPTAEELAALSAVTKIPVDFFSAALDPEETSRIESDENVLLVIVNIAKAAGTHDFDTVPLGVILTPDFIITVCLEQGEVLPRSVVSMNGFCTYKRTRFLLQILYKTATQFLKYLRQINRRSDEIEAHLRKSMRNEELYQLFDLEKGLTYFTAALRSNRMVVDKLLRLFQNGQMRETVKIREEDEDLLQDVQVEYNQAFEMVQMYGNVLTGMMDAFASIISNNLNMVMKFLTSVTIVLAIPTAIASFWGMNVPVPWQGSPNGFAIVTLFSLGVSALSALWLWRKRLL